MDRRHAHPRQELQQRAEQRLVLAPRMLQSITVLELQVQDLARFVEDLALSNEAIELDARAALPPPRPGIAGREATARHDEWIQNAEGRGPGPIDRARQELACRDLDPNLAPWTELVLDALDEEGFLRATDAELLGEAGTRGLAGGAEQLERGIALVRSLEPRGIGARSGVEALLLQLDQDDADHALVRRLLVDFLDELARNKLPAIARALGIDLARLESLLAIVRGLEVRPFGAEAGRASPSIAPDVVVERTERGFEVRVEDAWLPPVEIDPRARRMAADASLPRSVRARLKAKLTEARWLAQAVENRKATLLRVARAMFEHQGAFLEDGTAAIAPLSMQAVAEELGLATSTVSRAVAGKHAWTPHGLLPLRRFFATAAGGASGASRDTVAHALAALVATEDAHAPLSDDDLVARLRTQGHDIARRTVAKYRCDLGIESSYRRRKFA